MRQIFHRIGRNTIGIVIILSDATDQAAFFFRHRTAISAITFCGRDIHSVEYRQNPRKLFSARFFFF